MTATDSHGGMSSVRSNLSLTGSQLLELKASTELLNVRVSSISVIQNQISGDLEADQIRTTKIFESIKSFWRSGKAIGVIIFEHKRIKKSLFDEPTSVACIEVIAYNTLTGKEAPHLHFSSAKIFEKAKEKNVNADCKYAQDLVAKFIFNRINIIDVIDNDNNDSNFHVALLPLISDQLLGKVVDDFEYEGERFLGPLPLMNHQDSR